MKQNLLFFFFKKEGKGRWPVTCFSFLFLMLFYFSSSYGQSGTINFDTSNGTNLGTVANDGEGGSLDISGVVFNIQIINASGTPTAASVYYLTSGAPYEGLASSTNPGSNEYDGMSIKTDDGSEFDFNGFTIVDWGFTSYTLTISGYKNGSFTGSVNLNFAGNYGSKAPPA